MKLKIFLVLILLTCTSGIKTQNIDYVYESDTVKIIQIRKNVFQHISFLDTEDYGKVAANGMFIIDNGEAIIFDTPINDSDSAELLEWIKNDLKCEPIGIVATHFHIDCVGGLKEFHKRGIPSYASNETIRLATLANNPVPQNGFNKSLEIKVGNQYARNEYFGEGHTKDNVISYFSGEKVIFGGCLIKEVGAGKGYLGDANIDEWPNTVAAIKAKYPNVEIIIPGHGKAGGLKLLDYTIQLFAKK